MHHDQNLAALLAPWGRAVPNTDAELDRAIDHFSTMKQKHPSNQSIDRILLGFGALMRDRAAALLAAH